jgi:asparagine synthase (glutamine-hydrolysing)
MCGLCGLALSDPTAALLPERLLDAARSMKHRGPDDDGVHVAHGIAIAFRRLSIIDLEGGHQPLFNEQGDVALVLNGEIYNFRELRAQLQARGHVFRTGSDAECVVHLYEEKGEALLGDLIGMFAFALIDGRDPARPRLLLGRDRLGIKPLYFAVTPEGLAWASEPKAILELTGSARELRREALLEYLVQGYVGGEHAAWAGMRRLPPAHTLSWRRGEEPRCECYWDLPRDRLREAAEPDERSAEVLEWLDRCVRDRLEADVPLGAFLSGGIDSSAVVDSMSRSGAGAPVACSVGFQEKSHDELEQARRTARRLGCVHHASVLTPDPRLAIETLPWFFDEPHADPSTVPTYLVSKVAREHVTVALSGDGGDETFAGYRRYTHDVAENRVRAAIGSAGREASRWAGRLYPKLDWAPRALRARTFLTNVGLDPARAYWNSVTQLSRDEALELLHPDLAAALADHDPFDAFSAFYNRPSITDPLYRAQYADFHTYLPDQILAKVDRASMAVSLEARVPLLDHRFVERFAPLPAIEKVRGRRGKHALREALRGRLPAEILDGAKRGFDTPLCAWIRGPLAGAVSEAIETLPADWFDRARLAERLRAHSSGQRDHSRLLWSLLVLEHWRRTHRVRGLAA